MAHGHHRSRGNFSVHESPRAWVSYSPTSDESLLRGLNIVRRSDAQTAIGRFAPTLASELRRNQARRFAAVYSSQPSRLPAKRLVSPRGLLPGTMERVQAVADRFWFCAQRKIRREVMFALDLRRRRGSGGGRKKRFTEESFLKCVG